MKKFRKMALAVAISAVSSSVVAELQLLDDEGMEQVSGQAGLTIDVETQWEIGEFAYEDAGFLIIQGIRMGGNSMGNGTGLDGTMLDNLRLEIDVAGDGSTPGDNVLAYGHSNMRDIAKMYDDAGNADGVFASIAAGVDSTRDNLAVDAKKTYGDGDLVIHFDFTDGWEREGGLEAYAADPADRFLNEDYDSVEGMLEHAVDFRFEIDGIGLARSDYEVGSKGLDVDGNHNNGLHQGDPGTTTLISRLGVQGYLGPEDVHIENNGNGFDGTGPGGAGTGNADSKITWATYYKITDLDMYIDIAGVQITDMKIHNIRGDLSGLDGTSAFGFAHSIREIYAINEAVIDVADLAAGGNGYRDGIAINTRFKGDIDIGAISFGDEGVSIGSIYITDIESVTNWTVSAH